MAWHLPLPLGDLAVLVLAAAIVALITALLRRGLAPENERGAGEGGALAEQDRGRNEWLVHARAALAARAAAERAGEPAEATPATSSASSSSSVSETFPPAPTSRRPQQPGDALLVELRWENYRTLDEKKAIREDGKLQSPVDPDDADRLRALW